MNNDAAVQCIFLFDIFLSRARDSISGFVGPLVRRCLLGACDLWRLALFDNAMIFTQVISSKSKKSIMGEYGKTLPPTSPLYHRNF